MKHKAHGTHKPDNKRSVAA